MKKVLRIEDTHLYLPLNTTELSSVLDDVRGCADLLDPYIVIEGNCIRFRNEDIKLLQPELFFSKSVPSFVMDLSDIILLIGTFVFWTITYVGLVYLNMGSLDFSKSWFMLIAVLVLNSIAFIHHIHAKVSQRQRKALYVKARLLSYLYMVVNLEITTSNERLERTTKRLESDYGKTKQMVKALINAAPESIRMQFKDTQYPDGDYVVPDINEKPEKLS